MPVPTLKPSTPPSIPLADTPVELRLLPCGRRFQLFFLEGCLPLCRYLVLLCHLGLLFQRLQRSTGTATSVRVCTGSLSVVQHVLSRSPCRESLVAQVSELRPPIYPVLAWRRLRSCPVACSRFYCLTQIKMAGRVVFAFAHAFAHMTLVVIGGDVAE